jgi:hypothetical protein
VLLACLVVGWLIEAVDTRTRATDSERGRKGFREEVQNFGGNLRPPWSIGTCALLALPSLSFSRSFCFLQNTEKHTTSERSTPLIGARCVLIRRPRLQRVRCAAVRMSTNKFAALPTEETDDGFCTVSYANGRRRKTTATGAPAPTATRGAVSGAPARAARPVSSRKAQVKPKSAGPSKMNPLSDVWVVPASFSVPPASTSASTSTVSASVAQSKGKGKSEEGSRPPGASASTPKTSDPGSAVENAEVAVVVEQYAECLRTRRRPVRDQVDVVIYHKYCTDGFGAAWLVLALPSQQSCALLVCCAAICAFFPCASFSLSCTLLSLSLSLSLYLSLVNS